MVIFVIKYKKIKPIKFKLSNSKILYEEFLHDFNLSHELEKMRVIEEIWIINSSGITIFNLSKEGSIDPILIGGFFSAIQNIAKELGEDELNSIILGESKITVFHGHHDLLYISRSKKKVKDKEIIKNLKLVEQKFTETYKDKNKDVVSDLDDFKDFGGIIEEIFADTPEKRTEAALW